MFQDGHNIIFGSRNQQKNEEVVQELTQLKGGTLKSFPLDLSKKDSISQSATNINVQLLLFRIVLTRLIF